MPLSATLPAGVFSRIKLYLALSRTPHGLLDMTMPVAAALLWLGSVPPLGVMLLGLFTVFAGYTAVYAVNDLADYKTDRANYLDGPGDNSGYLDAVYARHPMAMGLLTPRQGMLWAGGWALASLLGAYALNPVCALLLLSGCALEALYCLLLKVSHLRALVNGVVKSLGRGGRGAGRGPGRAALVSGAAVHHDLLLGDRRPEHSGRLVRPGAGPQARGQDHVRGAGA